MLVMNKNQEAKEVALDHFRKEVIGDAEQGVNIISGAAVSLNGNSIQVEGRSFLLLEIDL